MQEAYCLLCSEYSFCCTNWVPPSRVTPPLAGYPDQQGTPPPAGPDRVPPPLAGPGRVPPPQVSAPWHSGKCCKALWDIGTPPVDRQIDGWKDRRVSKDYLPVVLRMWAVIKRNDVKVCFTMVYKWNGLQTQSIHYIFFPGEFVGTFIYGFWP